VTEAEELDFEPLLLYLKEARGFDFTGYKRASLSRRIQRRMESLGISDVGEYVDVLQVDPDEFTALFNFILINVTSFFRDPQIWDFIGDEVVPRILETHGDDEPIRVWVPGCASGEEPYSAAMVFAERMGIEAARQRVKIYATDIDDEALAQARAAT
jgi:two-component system, chemotaxis family, CheB/CheR fusion protein